MCKYLGRTGEEGATAGAFPVEGKSETRVNKAVKLCLVRRVGVVTVAAVKARGSCVFRGGLIAYWARSTIGRHERAGRASVIQASAAPQCHAIGLN